MNPLHRGWVALAAACLAASVSAAGLTPAQRAAARVHAQEVAELFDEACLDQKADPDRVADWALNHGFVIDSESGREVAQAMKARGEMGNVFSRTLKDETVLLIASVNPSNCVVMGLATVDGPRLRGRMEALAEGWQGVKVTAEAKNSMDYDDDGPHRRIAYLGEAGAVRYRLMVVSPLGAARGTVILGLSVEPAR